MLNATGFILVPVTRGVDELELELFLRENNYCFSLPASLNKRILPEYNKGEKSLGVIIKEVID